MEFKKNEQQMLMDQQSQMHKQQLEMMKMVQQQNQSLMALLEKSYIHKVTITSLLKIFETYFKTGCT